MSEDRLIREIQTISTQTEILYKGMMQLPPQKRQEFAAALEEIAISLDNLQLMYEQMLTTLEAAEVFEEELWQQLETFKTRYQHYFDLFQFAPIACLLTDPNGIIQATNQAAARLLNVPQNYLVSKPLSIFIPEAERSVFRTKVNQLSEVNDAQIWQMNLCPRKGKPFPAGLTVAVVRNDCREIEALRIGVYNLSQRMEMLAVPAQQLDRQTPTLPQSLDDLQVLIVDDEADAREFVSAVLESHGIRVTAVASAAAALETLETFHPDVLVCDIRMPGTDGYNLIRQIRALEAQQGRHIPAAALTAYLDESREKALLAGFEAHLHKLAQPSELIEMVAQLAERGRKY